MLAAAAQPAPVWRNMRLQAEHCKRGVDRLQRVLLLARTERHGTDRIADLPRFRNVLRGQGSRSLRPRIQPNDDDIIRARLAETWGFRTRAEIEATARFSRLADDLSANGGTPVVIQGAREASSDEARHRDLCATLAAQWGRAQSIKHVAPNRSASGRSDMDPRDRLLGNGFGVLHR